MGFKVEVLRDSVSPAGVRLTTLVVTLPRIVLAEFNTHRMLSRNSASSRAIPVEKRIAAVQEDPFIPEVFGKNRPGMQATEDLSAGASKAALVAWRGACADAVARARQLAQVGVHKQLANRVLEPFLWHTIVVTATEWSNFFALRCHPDAQPEIRRAAEMMREAMSSSTPLPVGFGGWHLPFVDDEEAEAIYADGFTREQVAEVSAARCARVSYLTHDGVRSVAEDCALALRLREAGHMSPFEHAATPQAADSPSFVGNFRGWVQLRKMFRSEADFSQRGVS